MRTRPVVRAPMLPVAVGLILGVVCDSYRSDIPWAFYAQSVPAARWIYLAVFVLAAGLAIRPSLRRRFGLVIVVAASFAVGALWNHSHARVDSSRSDHSIADIDRFVGETERHSNAFRRVATDNGRIARIRARIISEPIVIPRPDHAFAAWTYGSERTVFIVATQAIETTGNGPTDDRQTAGRGVGRFLPTHGKLRVSVSEAVLDIREGENVELFGWLRALKPPANPGMMDWSKRQRRQGIRGALFCDFAENITRLDEPAQIEPSWASRIRNAANRALVENTAAYAGPKPGLLEAMLLGRRQELDRSVDEAFVRAGCAHLLAVSGLHVAIPMMFAWALLRRFNARRRTCALAMLAVLLTYAVIVEPRPPVLRATVMGTLFCVSLFIGRPRVGLNWLAVSAVVLTLAAPQMVFTAGFQLSFLAVLGIILLPRSAQGAAVAVRGLYDRVVLRNPFAEEDRRIRAAVAATAGNPAAFPRRLWRACRRYVLTGIVVSVSAWLATLPIVMGSFGRVHPWSPISTLVMFPLVYVLLILGFGQLVLGVAAPTLGAAATPLRFQIEQWLSWLAEHLSRLPGASWEVSTVPWWWVAVWYVALSAFVWRFNEYAPQPTTDTADPTRRARAPRQVVASRGGWANQAWVGSLALLTVATWAWNLPRRSPDELIVTCLAVGDGLATVIELPGGQTVLYDAGSRRPNDVARAVVLPYLRHRGIDRIDRIFISHPNLDHFSAVPTLLDAIPTGAVVVNSCFAERSRERSPAKRLLMILEKAHHPVEVLDSSNAEWSVTGRTALIDGVEFELLYPHERSTTTEDPVCQLSANDTSTVLRLRYQGWSILFTGDLETKGLARLLAGGDDLSADVLVLPHHGAVVSNTGALLDAVGASVLVVSSGRQRAAAIRSVHAVNAGPHGKMSLATLAGDTPLFITADAGAVEITLSARGVGVRVHRDGRRSGTGSIQLPVSGQ